MFSRILHKIFGSKDLVKMENTKNQFTVKFDPQTQTFRKVLFYEDTGKFEFERL